MNILKLIEKYFWAVLLSALAIGMLLPEYGKDLEPMLTPILMLILFFVFLKTDYLLILKQFKNPTFIIYILTLFLIIIPSATYLIMSSIDENLAIGLLLLAATPPAVAAPVLTDIVKGDRSLSLAIVIPSYLFAPIVIPLMFSFWTGARLDIDGVGMSKVLLLMIFIPLVASQIVKRLGASRIIKKTEEYFGGINILLVGAIVFVAISMQADFIKENPEKITTNLAWVYGLFVIMQIAGYLSGFWRKKEDKLALAITKGYPNNALATVLALQFFTPGIVIITVLSQFPWNTLIGPSKWVSKHLK